MAEPVTAQERQSIDQLHAALDAEAAGVDLCAIWGTVEPHWAVILGVVAKIPVVGKALAAILGAFGKALDACCPNAQEAVLGRAEYEIPADERGEIEAAFGDVFGGDAKEKPCCNIWKKVKKRWPIILAVVRRIPGIGPKLADILQRLGDALDKFCG